MMAGAGVEPGTLLGGTYRIVRRIGSGGMGEVYEATHERLAHRYAVKFLHPGVRDHPEALPRFMREAQVTSLLRHPAIVSVVDFNSLPDGSAYLVMEYLEGESLGKVLARTGPLPLQRVVDITDQVSAALTAAHLRGVVHRDMHPQNVFVMQGTGGQSERIKVLDFGISKIASISQKITGMAAVMGTPQYMSPEQAEGKGDELDAASDQFSLAAIIYEMLTGRKAFAGDTLASVAYQIVHARPVPIHDFRPELPVELENVVSRGLAKNKRDRFPSVSELAVHLRWTATLPTREVAPRRGAEEGVPVVADTEETTAVSALPSGMAAVLRESTELPAIAAAAKREAANDELTVVAGPQQLRNVAMRHEPTMIHVPRHRLPVIGAVVASALVIVAIVVGVVSRSRKPPLDGAAAKPPADSVAANAPVAAPAPAPSEPTAVVPAPAVADGAAAAASPEPAPTEMDTPDPPGPASEAGGARKSPARTRPRGAGAVKVPAAAGRVAANTPAAPGTGQCRITVGTYPWSQLWIDGADTGQHTPVVDLPIACGNHKLEFKRRDLRISQSENVTLNEGRDFRRQYELKGTDGDE
jgi:tRNA A-37 threonylcarbamoyl transferase component Bud32